MTIRSRMSVRNRTKRKLNQFGGLSTGRTCAASVFPPNVALVEARVHGPLLLAFGQRGLATTPPPSPFLLRSKLTHFGSIKTQPSLLFAAAKLASKPGSDG